MKPGESAIVRTQDVPINRGTQAAKHSRFLPGGIYGSLETALQQFNVWLLEAYRRAMAGWAALKGRRSPLGTAR